MRLMRFVSRGLRRVKPWAENVLQILDWADWKTWVWYSLLGLERIANAIVLWSKRQQKQAELRMTKNGVFYVARKRG